MKKMLNPIYFSWICVILLVACKKENTGTDDTDPNSPCESKNPHLNPDLTYGCIKDIEGNTYATIEINGRMWMAENLRTGTFRNGASIPHVTDNTEWDNLDGPGWSYYNNNEGNNALYGKLYNQRAVDIGLLCPSGWHIPTHEEWMELFKHLGFKDLALKSTAIWKISGNPSFKATNSSGFTLLPAGYRLPQGSFGYFGERTHWRSATSLNSGLTSWGYDARYDYDVANHVHLWDKVGASCRCVKD